MAYKFQLGSATLSGSTTFEEDVTVASLDASNGGITQAGAIAGATTIAGSGLASLGSLAIDDGSTIGTDSDTDMLTLTNGSNVAVASDLDFNIVKTGGLQLGGVAVTSTAAELNLLDTAVSGTVVNSKAVIYGAAGEVNGSSVSGSGALAGASLQVGGNSVISNFEGTGLSVSAGTLNAATDVIDVTGHGITTNTQLSGGFNFSNASPQTGDITRTIPASSGLAAGQIFYIKAGNLDGNTLFVSASSGDLIDQQGQVSIESDGGAIGVIYVGGTNFNIF